MKKLVAKITIVAAAVMLVGGGLLVMPKEASATKSGPCGDNIEARIERGVMTTCEGGASLCCIQR